MADVCDSDRHTCPVCFDDCECPQGAIDEGFCTCCDGVFDLEDLEDVEVDPDEDIDSFC
jgi:hypothetical protein